MARELTGYILAVAACSVRREYMHYWHNVHKKQYEARKRKQQSRTMFERHIPPPPRAALMNVGSHVARGGAAYRR